MNKKTIGIVLISLIVIAGLASAALLGVYGKVVGTVTLDQSVKVNGELYDTTSTFDSSSIGGNTFSDCNNDIANGAEIPAYVAFGNNAPVGYTVTYWRTLELENKDASWDEILTDNMSGTLQFQFQADQFHGVLDAKGLTTDTDYDLIYYADPWPNTEGALIATVTTDANGELIDTTILGDIEVDIPSTGDDNFANGGKIWLVPSTDYDGSEMTAWNPTMYLFEHELVTFDDTTVNTGGATNNLGLLLPAESGFDFCIQMETAINTMPGTHTVKTTVSPVV